MPAPRFGELAAASRQLAGTASRNEKKRILVDLLARVPVEDAPAKPAIAATGRNPVSCYSLEPWFKWANNYIDVNNNNATTGPLEHQLYFRQALQSLVDERAWISGAFNGYAYPDYGPVPGYPKTSYLSSYEQSDPYSFSIARARQLLTSHGWTIPASGAATCTDPGTGAAQCGAGIGRGQSLTLSLLYSSGLGSIAPEMQDFQSNADQAGVRIALRATPLNSLFAMDAPCTAKQSTCSWQMLYFGGPVSFQPYWYPDNSLLFICGSFANTENYCDPGLDAMYGKVFSETGVSALQSVENYETSQAPLLWVPVEDQQLSEVADDLGGYTQSGTGAIAPEDWYFTAG